MKASLPSADSNLCQDPLLQRPAPSAFSLRSYDATKLTFSSWTTNRACSLSGGTPARCFIEIASRTTIPNEINDSRIYTPIVLMKQDESKYRFTVKNC